MTIDKAQRILKEAADGILPLNEKDLEDAQRLGSEALKVIKEFRTGLYKTINSPLPGETEE